MLISQQPEREGSYKPNLEIRVFASGFISFGARAIRTHMKMAKLIDKLWIEK
jgi:hypothetical protein